MMSLPYKCSFPSTIIIYLLRAQTSSKMPVYYGTNYDSTNKIWSGPKQKDFYNYEMTLGEAIVEQLHLIPDKVVQIMDSTGEQVKAKDLLMNSKNIVKNFVAMGLMRGDVIGLYASNTTHLSAVILAAWLTGLRTHAAYEGCDKDELKIIFDLSKPKILFCDLENSYKAQAANQELNLKAKIYLMHSSIDAQLPSVTELMEIKEHLPDMALFPCFPLNGDDAAVILCSSGTTGPPKGVLCSHQTLLNCHGFQTFTPNSVAFTFSSTYWWSGLCVLKETLLKGGLRIITNQPFSPEYFLHLIERYKITHVIANPSQLAELCLKQNNLANIGQRMSSIDTMMCCGSKVLPILSTKMLQLLKSDNEYQRFLVTYGFSEISALLASNYLGQLDTEGLLAPNLQVRIVDRSENLLGPNEHGEIQCRFPYKWLGYLNNPTATQKCLTDNWFRTGDIGYFDEDGCLHICSRIGDVFKSNNIQIYPEKVENILMKLRGVQECCVFGQPDVIKINLVACAVVKTKDSEGENLNEAKVYQFVEEELPPVYHLKGGIYFLERLPRTGSGKLLRRKVIEMLQKKLQKNTIN
uniref:AMP-dependent synthetase/ligase domain-containing protein n=1 Tax=Glossina palpalis gambiensis TaxID=67801 RepID=A0A1B0AXC9_9MUSC